MSEPAPRTVRPVAAGVAAIKACLQTAPDMAGCYRMLDAGGKILYIGKAKQLPKRLASYTRIDRLPVRTRRMIAQTDRVECTVTHSEAEALLMEANLIRRYKPRFNILLKDDKSFAQILIRRDHPYPHLGKFRGRRKIEGDYFGPFSNAQSIARTLVALQRAFLLRNCPDRVFAARKRPCLQYQIKRCSAPCVGYVTREQYTAQADSACKFLRGQDKTYRARLIADMENAAEQLDFERAIELRNRLQALTHVQGRQDIHIDDIADCDLLSFVREQAHTCFQIFFFRDGQHYGNRAYFPRHEESDSDNDIIESFLAQFYTVHLPPPVILLDRAVANAATIEKALYDLRGEKAQLKTAARKYRATFTLARDNARLALKRQISEKMNIRAVYDQLATILALPQPPVRIEVYDNAHLQGDSAVGGMIVAGQEGFVRGAYRHFKFRTGVFRDDYAMMREMLTRRFSRPKSRSDEAFGSDEATGDYLANLPDLVIIDGGKGHLTVVKDVFTQLNLQTIPALAAAKGSDRIATEFYASRTPGLLTLPDAVRLYLNQLQEEAHRFANHLHRRKRAADSVRSALDSVPGIGPGRKRALIRHFSSAKAVATAKVEDLQRVDGISSKLAHDLHDYFNPNETGS